MADIFGYSKRAKGPGDIVSPSMVMVSINGSRIYLAQEFSLNYTRQVTPNYELGSDSVYLTAGHSSGTASISRAVGETGLLEPYMQSDPCQTDNLFVGKGEAACGMDPGAITAIGCIKTAVGLTLSVGGTVVTDNAQWVVGSVSRG